MRLVTVLCVAAVMALVYVLDRHTTLAHVQHLYYFPIIVAAIELGMSGGVGAAGVAIVLYHLAKPHALTWRYEESDILQMGVFIAAGIVAAMLADDRRRLHQLAMTDDLTGLHNLRSFELEVRSMTQLARGARTPLSLLVVDLDRLKSLNDEHGHLAGAEAVRTVGRLIADHIPVEAVACRYGGDEFVIALPDCPAAIAHQIADDLRRAVNAATPTLAGLRLPEQTLSISVGLACRAYDELLDTLDDVEVDDSESEALFRTADAALYAAKNGGRNRVQSA